MEWWGASTYNQPWERTHFDEPALTGVDRNVDISRAEVVEGVLHTRLHRTKEVPGEGTVAISRIVGRGRWTAFVDGQHVARIDGTTATSEPGPFANAVNLRGDQIVLHCAEEAHTFTFEQDR
ncbi:hypothetical protein [Streptomyces mirabilis]|uniref:hypothetical protein n=1 Tax=Streptomyces mirabilis TaxID=68239 RepID=UPI00367A3EB4